MSFQSKKDQNHIIMACAKSSNADEEELPKFNNLVKPAPWKYITPITRDRLKAMRDEFWNTAPQHGGRKEIWYALRRAAEVGELHIAQAIIDGAGIVLRDPDMSLCSDERGAMYDLPMYVLSDPTNLIRDN